MTQSEIKKLLALAMSYDNRRPGEANVAAWAEAADRGRWTFDAAVEAIHEHYVRSADFIMPAHITTFVRSRMRQPGPVSDAVAHLEGAQPASEETRRKAMDAIRGFADKFKPPGDAA